MEPRIWLIGGPTASGKTAISLRLAREIDGEIINADSIQLYRDLEILSARPAPDELGQAPHHLFGVADAAEACSVGRWQRAALPIIAEVRNRGKSPILVGGTGLYFRSLTHGLAEIPASTVETRAAVAADFETLGEAAFRDRLAQVDPTAAARIAPGDRQRLARAWEVYLTSGQSLSALQTQTTAPFNAGDWRGVARSGKPKYCDLYKYIFAKSASSHFLRHRLSPFLLSLQVAKSMAASPLFPLFPSPSQLNRERKPSLNPTPTHQNTKQNNPKSCNISY